MSLQVHLVWAVGGAIRTVLHAFIDLDDAEKFVQRAERCEYDDGGHARMSPCEVLDIRLSIESISVKQKE